MRLNELAGQRQAETKRGIAPTNSADAMEAGEHVLLIFGRDPLAIIGHRNRYRIIVAPRGERDLALVRGVSDRVAKHVLERFAQAPGIADHHAGGRIDVELESAVGKGTRVTMVVPRAPQ